MRRRLGWAVIAGVAAIGAAGTLVSYVFQKAEETRPPGATIPIPAIWRAVRESPGHTSHLTRKIIECASCHNIERDGFVSLGSDVCVRCHAEQKVIHHQSPLAQQNNDCLACHGFGADDRREQDCGFCHDEPRGFIPAIEGHGGAPCVGCHSPHEEPALRPRECIDCHKNKRARHGSGGVLGAQACVDCHQVHDRENRAPQRCVTCHSTEGAGASRTGSRRGDIVRVRRLFEGHNTCVTCHTPHEFTRAGASTCVSCHTKQRTLAARTVSAHRQCDNCHETHDARAVSDATCNKCHAKVTTPHVPDAEGQRCLGCHPIHPKAEQRVTTAVACSSCHTQVASDTDRHSGDLDCVACHPPHGGRDLVRGVSCQSCHAGQTALAQTVRGHRDCAKCHERAAHEPKITPPSCETCHREERRTAPRGHRECDSCHRRHDGRVTATCASCHETRAVGNHASISGGCMSCHRPHGPRGRELPGTCIRCHDQTKLPGLHTNEGHANCGGCHEAHEREPKRTRRPCAACHNGLERHEPRAKVCTGCHVFRHGLPADQGLLR